jgi:hexosaminidase
MHHPNATLGPKMDESYALDISAQHGSEISVVANTAHGVLRALESLLHLVSFTQPGRVLQAPVTVRDKPRFAVRGLMINPSGDWMPVSFLKKVVDGLVVNKMNYLHIHFTDVASFPIVSQQYPQLASKGRYGRLVKGSPENETTYSKEQLRSLVAYAADRGVRVVPEFDMVRALLTRSLLMKPSLHFA